MSTCISKNGLYPLPPVPDLHRRILASLMLVTVLFGWRWPVLGFLVPVSMLVGTGGSFLRGRYVCGNLCPRGSFLDTVYRLVGGNRAAPAFLSRMPFRLGVMALLMTLMALQIARNPSDPVHWGEVFWLVCVATTAIALVLGRIYRARTWCYFCPVGTLANAIGGAKDPLQIAPHCKGCVVCEKSCPMDLSIGSHKMEGVLPHRDCLKCSSCVESCQAGALSFAGK